MEIKINRTRGDRFYSCTPPKYNGKGCGHTEKIKLAKEAVDGENEPYKTEAFKIILSKLLESKTVQQTIDLSSNSEKITKATPIYKIEEKTAELADKCDLTIDELDKVIFIKDNTIEITSPISGSDARKHFIVTLCLLASYDTIHGQEWISSQTILDCLRSMGVRDITNLSSNLGKYPDLIITRGTRGHKEYRLTSGQGRIFAFNIIHKLGKGDKLEKDISS